MLFFVKRKNTIKWKLLIEYYGEQNTMKKRILKKTSIFPADKDEVYDMLLKFETLSKVASPYMKFIPVNNDENLIWKEGETLLFKSKLLGFIPIGIHEINVIELNKESRIYTNEKDPLVPIWNHEIILNELEDNKTEYTDEVEIYAGWKTIFVYIFAKLFYSHRQRKWIKILNSLK